MFIENVFLLIFFEVIMGLGGIVVVCGSMEFWLLFVVGILGLIVGNYVWFLVGDWFGYWWFRLIVDCWGCWLMMEWYDVENVMYFFCCYG